MSSLSIGVECEQLWIEYDRELETMNEMQQIAYICESAKDPEHRFFTRNTYAKSDSDQDRLRYMVKILWFLIDYVRSWKRRNGIT